MSSRRRDDDRPHDDRYKSSVPRDRLTDRDYDRRRHRSATMPSQSYDSKSHPYQPPDTRRSSRAYRQEAHYTTAAPSASHHPVPGSSSSRMHHPPRSSAQNPSAGYHMATPYQASTPSQPSQAPHTSKGYPAATTSSRRDNIDPRSYSSRRGQTASTLKPSYEHASSADDVGRSSRQPYLPRTTQPSTQTTANVTTPSVIWASSTQDAHGKRSKDRDKGRDQYRDERDRERNTAELDRDRHRERHRSEVHREKDKAVESEKYREPSRFRNEKKMESDSEGLVHPDNASKASLSGREGYQPSVRESISGHRRHRTDDGLLSSTARRPHAEPSHNPASAMYMQSTGSQATLATGNNTLGVGSNPPPAPRVMPVYLPQKPQKSHHERHASSAAHGGQSSSDAERASVKHRMERNHSGTAVQRGDAYVSSAVRERQGQEGPAGPREDTRSKLEAKYSTQATYYNSRQPLQPASVNTVDIPLITPGFNSSPLPHESRGHVGTIPVLVAGEGPADHQTHDALSKLQAVLRRDELQDARYPHVSHAPVGKPSLGRSQSSEVPPLHRSRTDSAAVNFLHDRHYRSDDLVPPPSVSQYPEFTNMAAEQQSSQPRPAPKASFINPPGGPRPQPSSSYADHQNESTRPVTAVTPVPAPMARAASNQPSAPPPIARVVSNQPSVPPPMTRAASNQPSIPVPPPMTRAASNQPSVPVPPPMTRAASNQPSVPVPPPMTRAASNQPSVPVPPPMTRAASNQPSVPVPPPMTRAASNQPSVPVPPPMTRAASNQPPVPVPPPMTRAASNQPSVPVPPPMTRTALNQPSVPPSPAQKTNSSPAKIELSYGSLPSAHASQPHLPGTHGTMSIKRTPSTPPSHLTPTSNSQAVMDTSQPYTRSPHPSEPPSRPSPDRPEPHVIAPRMTTAQMSNGGTIKSSWVVQTAQADGPLKNGYSTREEKYTARNGSNQPFDPPAVAHPQLREVLSQDHHYPTQVAPTTQPRAASTQGSPKRSPYGAPKDMYTGPRRTPDSSPHMLKVKEAATPEQSKVSPFPSPALGPPQIAVIGPTPSSMNQELPHRSQYNASLLTPSYPAPSRVSRTTSGSREYQTQAQPQIAHTHSVASTASHQQSPVLLPQPVAPQAPQPSQPSSYASNAGGQFSPPPLPVPPPRLPGVDIAEDIFPVKPSSASLTGFNPPPPSPIVPWKPIQDQTSATPASTPMQPSVPDGHSDSHKNKPWTGEGTGAAPTPLPAVSRPTQPSMPNGHSDSYKNKPWADEGTGAAPTPVPAVSLPTQSSIPNGHSDSYKNKPWAGEGTGAAPTPVLAVSREATVAAPVEVRTYSTGATGAANGVNQGTPVSQHPPPSQGAPVVSHSSARPSPQLKRPKVTIEEVPESPMFTNKWAASPSQSYPQTQAPTQASKEPMHSSSVPATKAQASEASAPRSTPPSKPKDVPVRSTPTAVMPTQSYTPPAPSTQHQAYAPASSRPPYSAPPMQSSFSSSYADAQPRGYQRPTDAQPSAKPPMSSASAAAAQSIRSASQPMNVPQSALLDAASRGKQYPATAATPHSQTLSTAETHTKPQFSRPPASASVVTAQATRPAAYSPNTHIAPLDAASNGRQYTATSTATAATPQPSSLPTVETQTNPQSSRPITNTSVAAAQVTRPVLHPLNTAQGAPLDLASKGRQQAATATATTGASLPQSQPTVETHVKPHSSRPVIPPVTIPQGPSVRPAATSTSKSQVQDASIPNDSSRYRGFLSSANRYASAAMNPLYPATHHPAPATSNQQSKPPLSAYSNSHLRTVSLPQHIPSSNANPRPPSPRKASQPLVNSSATSTQAFPATSSQANAPSRSAKAAESSWSSRVAVSGHPSTPAPFRAHLPASSHESELLTPSSIAPSMPKTPQMHLNSVTPTTAPPMRQRQVSTDSKESKKKSGGFLGGLFRTKSGSSRPLESPIAPSPVKTFIGGQKSPTIAAPPIQQSKSYSSAKESKDKAATAAKTQTQTAPNPPTSMSVQPKASKAKAKVPDLAAFPPLQPAREQRQPPSSNVFSQFSFLTSKRKRTVSGASVDVCDGSNTANTVVGSPYVTPIQPLPPMPPIRDPMLATGEWRDRAEAEQQKRKKNRFRPGVTFDVEEDPPDPHPGRQKGARLVRRKSGPGPR